MAVSRLMTRPCTWLQRTDALDAYGDNERTESSIATVCELQPIERLGADREVDNSLGIEEWKVYLPGTILPSTVDALIIDGATYEFSGPPNTQRNPRTGVVMFTQGFVKVAN